MLGSSLGFAAVIGANATCVQILADQKRFDFYWSDPNLRGETPLYRALERGLSDIVKILVKKGQDYNARTVDGATLGHAAVFEKDPGGKLDCVKILSTVQFEGWNVGNKDGNTPIMLAITSNRIQIVEVLANCPRVDLDFVSASGRYLEDVAR